MVKRRPLRGRRPRTQEERTATTRARLLDATIECLSKFGYVGTTTTVIAKRAGVSRGAQLHHFPTKLSLVTTAVEHLFERRHEEFREAIEALPEGADRITSAIDLLWSMISGPTFYAWLELVIAARTDLELKKSVAAIAERFDLDAQQNFATIFSPPKEMGPVYHVGGTLLFAALEGMATARIAIGDHPNFPKVLDLLKTIARLTLPLPKEQ